MNGLSDIYRNERTDFKVVKPVTMYLQGFTLDEKRICVWGFPLLLEEDSLIIKTDNFVLFLNPKYHIVDMRICDDV